MHVDTYLRRLERLSHRCGVPVVRNSLRTHVMGRIEPRRRIVLRSGLSPDQQLLTLVHELTHLLVHRHVEPKVPRTICEYEAETVERWVGTVLRIDPYVRDESELDTITDGLLTCSVRRVRIAAHLLLTTAHGIGAAAPRRLQPQTTVEIDAPAGEEIIFNDELRGMRDFIGVAKPF